MSRDTAVAYIRIAKGVYLDRRPLPASISQYYSLYGHQEKR